MRCCRCFLSLASAFALCGPAWATIVVAEYNGYRRGVDYDVSEVSAITIYSPSLPGVPYDFDCYDTQTGPAIIQRIVAVPGIGNVEVMVRPHDGRHYGASAACILINGQMDSQTDVAVVGQMLGRSSICVDYDGYDSGDDFDGQVCVGDPPTCYYENTPEKRIYRTTCFVGDPDNDNTVAASDKNFMLKVLQGTYDAAHPGLSGSKLYNADCNCDRR